VATSLNNLASVYREEGRYAEAEPFYQRARGDPGENCSDLRIRQMAVVLSNWGEPL